MLMAGLMFGGMNAYGQRPDNWGPGPGGGAGYGYGRGRCFGPGYQAGLGWRCTLNNLSDEQREKISDLRIEHYKAVSPLSSQVRINRARIDALMKEDEPDMNNIQNLIEENGKILTDIRSSHAKHRAEIRKLLTDEQKIIFDRWAGNDRGFFKRVRNIRPGRGWGERGYGRWYSGPGRGYGWWHSGPDPDEPEDQP